MDLKPSCCLQTLTRSHTRLRLEIFTRISVEMLEPTSTQVIYLRTIPQVLSQGVNKKVIGMFKDECGGKIMHEFVGLRAKLYSYKMYEGDEAKKCKGCKAICG